jgi:hypothetical protein
MPTTRVPVVPTNTAQFNGPCPRTAPVRSYDITAVLANDVLGNAVGATIPPNVNPGDNAGGPLNPAGGTLVYNPRPTSLAPPVDELANVLGATKHGPLHDPTAMMYVRTSDLGANGKLLAGRPVEPLVIRAGAGDCITVTLRNRLPAVAPDLAGFTQLLSVVPRDKSDPEGVTYFGNNLVRPSSHVGLHPQLVAHDVTTAGGMVVGTNLALPAGNLGPVVAPGRTGTFRWYAGDLGFTGSGGVNAQRITLVATPIEFGGANLIPADPIKQGQKGLVGALSIGPAAATISEVESVWDHQQTNAAVTRQTRASATLGGTIRDFALVFQKGLNLRYQDGTAVENLASEGAGVPEDSGDAGSMALNYGTEPLWFRYGLQPHVAFGNTPGGLGAVPNPQLAYSNALVGGDPATPLFRATAGAPLRLHVLNPTGVTRGSVFVLHGHLWQRAPHVCPGQLDGVAGLLGKCNWTNFGAPNFELGSRAIGVNPIGMYLGAQESVLPTAHFDVILPGSGSAIGGAGGVGRVPGDYLFRDQGSFGNTSGLWGILRVE